MQLTALPLANQFSSITAAEVLAIAAFECTYMQRQLELQHSCQVATSYQDIKPAAKTTCIHTYIYVDETISASEPATNNLKHE